eukprot:2371108-Prymnesium_polylepis.2
MPASPTAGATSTPASPYLCAMSFGSVGRASPGQAHFSSEHPPEIGKSSLPRYRQQPHRSRHMSGVAAAPRDTLGLARYKGPASRSRVRALVSLKVEVRRSRRGR